ncbi:hypothetical protein Hdeb2414_s0016g00482631 [Helianthus debilis subsp. tardiflorus]
MARRSCVQNHNHLSSHCNSASGLLPKFKASNSNPSCTSIEKSGHIDPRNVEVAVFLQNQWHPDKWTMNPKFFGEC